MSRERPLPRQIAEFCKHHLGKHCFAPFTGQDHPAWNAFVYLLQCYSHGGGVSAVAAMQQTLRCVQRTENVLRVFAQAIPGVLDWGDVARLWPEIAAGILIDVGDARLLYAVERSECYVRDSKQAVVRVWHHGLNRPRMHVAEAAVGGAQ